MTIESAAIGLHGFTCPYDEDELLDTRESGYRKVYAMVPRETKNRLIQIASDRGQSISGALVELIVADLLAVNSLADRAIARWCPGKVPNANAVSLLLYCSSYLEEAIEMRRVGIGLARNAYLTGLITRAVEEPWEALAQVAELLGEAYTRH